MSRPNEGLLHKTSINLSQDALSCIRVIRLQHRSAGLVDTPDCMSKAVTLAVEELAHLIQVEIQFPGTIPFKNKV